MLSLWQRFWSDETFEHISAEEKLAVLYCLTGPQANQIGIFHLSLSRAASDLAIDGAKLPALFSRVSWRWDPAAEVLYIPEWFKYHSLGAKELSAALTDALGLPATPLLHEFQSNVRHLPAALHRPFRDFWEPTPEFALTSPDPKRVAQSRRDEAYEEFAEEFHEVRGVGYQRKKGDFVQLVDLRKRANCNGSGTPEGWQDGIKNYFGSELRTYNLSDFCVRYDIFLQGPVDRFGHHIGAAARDRLRSNTAAVFDIEEDLL